MDATTAAIVGLCLVGGVTWTVLLWSTQRPFRIFLGVSVALHAVLFIIPFAATRSTPGETPGLLVVPFTIIQGTDEPAPDEPVVEPPDEEPSDDTIRIERKQATEPAEESLPVDPGLPEIGNLTWFKFDDHPQAASYRKELQRVIQRHFEVPPELDERGYEGRLKVWLNLSRDGRLNYFFLDPRMRSQEWEINRLTEENIKKITDKFPPFPEGVKDYDVSFYVIIDYRNLRNR